MFRTSVNMLKDLQRRFQVLIRYIFLKRMGKSLMFRLFQFRIRSQDQPGFIRRLFKYDGVLEYIPQLKVHDPALADTEKIPGSAETQILK